MVADNWSLITGTFAALAHCRVENGGLRTMLSTILIIILILLLIGALPTWPYSSGWGYGPGGVLGLVLVIIIILALLGRI
jgi:peptidoglycan/LPS O-acetylase OafA/YrhL